MLAASISDFQLLLVHWCSGGQFFWKRNRKTKQKLLLQVAFFSIPLFFSLHKALKWYTCGGASEPPEPDRLPPREKERFDDFLMFGVELSDPILLSMEGQAFRASLLWTAQIEQRRSSWPVELLREDALEGFEKEMRGVKRMFISCTSPSLHGSVFTVAQYNVWKSILISKATDSSRLFMVFLLSFESVIWCWCFFFYSLRTLQKQWHA